MIPKYIYPIIILLFLTLVIPACDTEVQLSNVHIHKKDITMKYVDSFQIYTCKKITLEYFEKLSDSQNGMPSKSNVITDKSDIDKILALTQQLPNKGEIMIKMGDVPLLNVILTLDDVKTVYFSFYNSRVKTPASSFFSESNYTENKLYQTLKKFVK